MAPTTVPRRPQLRGLPALVGLGLLTWACVLTPTTVSGEIAGTRRWKFDPELTGAWSGASIGLDGTVYVSLCQSPGAGVIYAFEQATGNVRWQNRTSCVASTPAIGVDGTVFVGGMDGRMYALSPAYGSVRWLFQTAAPFDASPALGADGTVYIGCNDNNLYALDGASGEKRWAFATGGPIHEAPAIGLDGTVYTGSTDGTLYALSSASGVKKWDFHTGGPIVCSPAIGADGTIYFGSGDHMIYALDGASGTKRWEFKTTSPVDWSPAIADDMLVIGSNDGIMYSLETDTGETCWSLEFIEPISRAHPIVARDGNLYFGADKWLIALDHTTKVSPWSFTTQGVHNSSPIIGADGTIFFGSDNGPFYALWASNGGGLADSPWPVSGQSARHTGQAPGRPIILNQPTSQLVQMGGAATLNVLTAQAPPASFQWTLNGARLSNATNAALLLTNVQSAMLGKYQLTISNRFGLAISDLATLSLSVPPNITLHPRDEGLVSGGQVTLRVTAVGTRPLSYQWQFNGTNLVEATQSELALTNVSAAHAGHYSVVVSNAAGSADSLGAKLTVTTPPRLGIAPDGQLTLAGSLGKRYRIEFTPALGSNSWTLLTNVTAITNLLPVAPLRSADQPRNFYRALTSE